MNISGIEDLQFSGGAADHEGRVEVMFQGNWTAIYSDTWSLTDANVACRESGYGNALDIQTGKAFGSGTGPKGLMDISCSGKESSLNDCPGYVSGDAHCVSGLTAGVVCGNGKVEFNKNNLVNFIIQYMVLFYI